MKSRKFVLFALVVLVLALATLLSPSLAPPHRGGPTPTHSITLARIVFFEDPQVLKVGDYDVISIEGCGFLSNVGEPMLPVKGVLIELPSSNIVNVEFEVLESEPLEGTFNMQPAQPPVTRNSGVRFVSPDPQIYGFSSYYPDKVGELFDVFEDRGTSKAYIRIFPVQYKPATGEVTYYKRVEVSITVSMPLEGGQLSFSPGPGEPVDYLIITRGMFTSTLENFVTWKESRGLVVEVENVDNIVNDFSGRDVPEKIRNCIKQYYTDNGIKWVLLVGDADNDDGPPAEGSPNYVLDKSWEVPTRYVWNADGSEGGWISMNNDYTPTDYYYAGLDGTWDNDDDNLFGENQQMNANNVDEVDWYAEVYAGRISVRTTSELSTIISKTISFENNPIPSQYFLLFGAELGGASESGMLKEMKEDLKENYSPPSLSYYSLYEIDGQLTFDNVNSAINTYNPPFINSASHGGTYSLTLNVGGYFESKSTESNLTNSGFLQYANACLSNAFDETNTTGGYYGDALSENLLKSGQGAVAYVGGTRSIWGYTTYWHGAGLCEGQDMQFWENFFNIDNNDYLYRPGAVLYESKRSYIQEYAPDLNSEVERKNLFATMLLGDPELCIDAIPPAVPNLVWPDNNENINDNTPNLDWSPVSDVSQPVLYYVAVSDNSQFPHENDNSGWIEDDNYQLTTELSDGMWYWRVQAKDNAGNESNWSEVRMFAVDTVAPEAPMTNAVDAEPDPLINSDNRIGSTASSYTDARVQDGTYENIQENDLGSLSYTYVQSETVNEGGAENFDNAQADDGNYENLYENDYGTAEFDNYSYVTDNYVVKGSMENFENQKQVDGGYSTLSEVGAAGGENNNVDNEPDPLVDGSSRTGTPLGGTSYLQAQTQDSVYENIAENDIGGTTTTDPYSEAYTENVKGENLSSPDLLDVDDEDNYRVDAGYAPGAEDNLVENGDFTNDPATSGWENTVTIIAANETGEALWDSTDEFVSGHALGRSEDWSILWYQDFSATADPMSATLKFAWRSAVVVTPEEAHIKVILKSPTAVETTIWTKDYDLTATADTVWTVQENDVTSIITETGTWRIILQSDLYTGSAAAAEWRWDWDNVTLVSTAVGAYALDIRHDSAPVSYSGILENIRVRLDMTSENTATYTLEIRDWTNGEWDSLETVQITNGTEYLFDNTLTTDPENYLNPPTYDNIRVKLSTSEENDHISGEDWLRFDVTYTPADYRLIWEHRITSVDNTYENYKVIIYGYTDNLDENVGVYVWDNANSTWLFIDNLPTTPGASIENTVDTSYFAGDNLSLRYFENTEDSTATTVHIDYCALEGICTICSMEINENIDNVVTGPSNTYVLQIYFQLDNSNDAFRVQVENSTGGWENFDNLLTYQGAVWTTWENAISSDKIVDNDIVRLKFVDNNPDAENATDLWIDYLRVKSTTPTTTAYRENIQHDITGIPTGHENYTLQVKYYTAGDPENVSLYIRNFTNSTWDNAGNLQAGAGPFTFENALDSDHMQGGENVWVLYVQPDDDDTQTSLMIDYTWVKAESVYYALRWEHRIENVATGFNNYWVRVRGYTNGDSENVEVYIWENQSGTWVWSFIDNLTTAENTIEEYIAGENIGNYLVGDNLSIKYEDYDNTDDTQTTIHIDYFALEWASAALSPPHGASTDDSTPTFVWDAVTDPSGVTYTLQIDDEDNFQAPLVFENAGIPDNTYTLPAENALVEDNYYWRVRAVDGVGNIGGWSPVWQFTFTFEDVVAPAAPINLSASPSAWTTTNEFSVSWTNPSDTSGIAGAYYKLDNAPTSSTDGTYVAGSDITSISGITVSGDASHPIYVWLKDGSGNVDHANRASTNLRLDTAVPAAPTNLAASPSSWTNTNSFTVSWTNPSDTSGIAGAYYKLESVPTSSTDGTYTSGSDITSISGISVSGDGLHAVYVWLKDQAGNVDHANRNSTTFKLDTSAPSTPSLSAPTAPSDNAATNDNTPNLDWNSVTGAIKYTLQYATDNAFTENLTTVGDITDENYLIPPPGLADNMWYWRVKAIDVAANASAWSSTWSFIVDTVPPENAPVLLSPENNTTEATSTPTFLWTTVTDALSGLASYTLVMDNEPSFDSPYVIEKTGLTENTCALLTSEALEDGTYYWRVRAIDEAGNGIWADNFKLEIHAVLPPPELVSPDSGSATRDNTPKFEWSVAENAENYELEYSTASDLSANVTSITTDNNWYQVPDENALAENTWYWRVRALDNTGKVGNWSSTWSLIISEAPVYVVEVSIWPDNQTGTPGTTLPHYIVTVKNIGNVEDNYTLEVADDAGWELDLQKTSVTIEADESEEVRLMVTISDDAADGDVDIITVTVTSENDNTVSDSATCKAIARLRVVEFTFTFEPGGENGVADFENQKIPVFKVTIIVENVTDGVKGTVIVTVLENIEGPVPPGMVHRYVKIEPSVVNAGIKGLLARFRVSKSWVRQNNIGKGTIRVLERVENEWLELPTSFVDEDSAYLYYEAEALGFSLFAVTGEKAAAPMIWILAGVVAIVVVLAFWIRRRYYGPGVRIRIVFKTGLCELPPFKKGGF